MRVAEIYKSIQGEGRLTGTESVLVRASGCNLRCWFCDTPFASWHPEGEDLSVAEVLGRIELLNCQHVILTGGEPMLFAELIPLCEGIRQRGRHITIETAGTLYLPVVSDLMSISPKMKNSAPDPKEHARWHQRHEQSRKSPEVIRRLIDEYECQFKFVIDHLDDCGEVLAYLDEFLEINRDDVYLMPQGTTLEEITIKGEWLEPWCAENDLHYCPRRQIEWFGFVRGT
ncbi:MAG: radical SAM protein [Blastopirellula sp.]|nr:MAG: radical SAM protein [Blastopirellula sp.]